MNSDPLETLYERVIRQRPYHGESDPSPDTLISYVVGQASPQEAAAIEAYIESHPELKAEVDTLRAAREWFQSRNADAYAAAIEQVARSSDSRRTIRLTSTLSDLEANLRREVDAWCDSLITFARLFAAPPPAMAVSGYRAAASDVVEASFVDEAEGESSSPPVAFRITRAELEEDGRLTVAAVTADERIRGAESTCYAMLELRVGAQTLWLPPEQIERDGRVTWIVPGLPTQEHLVRIPTRALSLRVAWDATRLQEGNPP